MKCATPAMPTRIGLRTIGPKRLKDIIYRMMMYGETFDDLCKKYIENKEYSKEKKVDFIETIRK